MSSHFSKTASRGMPRRSAASKCFSVGWNSADSGPARALTFFSPFLLSVLFSEEVRGFCKSDFPLMSAEFRRMSADFGGIPRTGKSTDVCGIPRTNRLRSRSLARRRSAVSSAEFRGMSAHLDDPRTTCSAVSTASAITSAATPRASISRTIVAIGVLIYRGLLTFSPDCLETS